ncbi:hypothetical protein [Bacillus toyonensis]|nr:hypothetical protein [Bacillus toyonensis]
MQSPVDFLIALSIKLTEIADNTAAELEKIIANIKGKITNN